MHVGDLVDAARAALPFVAFAYSKGVAGAEEAGRAIEAALSAQPSPGGQDALSAMLPDDARLVGVIADNIERGKLDHPGFYRNTQLAEALRRVLSAALAARQPVGEAHADDLAVDGFAAAMKAKMAEARAKGRGGWEDPAQCSADDLSRMLRNHVEKGDPRDVANFCMMLHQRGEAISARQPVGEPAIDYEDLLDQAKDLIHCGCSVNGAFEWLLEQLTDGEALSAPPAQAVDLGDFKALYRAYVHLLESGRDRIIDLGGTCDPVDVMEANDVDLQAARRVLDSQAVGNG